MRIFRTACLALCALGCLIATGCGGKDGVQPPPLNVSQGSAPLPTSPTSTSGITVMVSDDGRSTGIASLKLNIVALELHVPGSATWVPIPLGANALTVDLLAPAPLVKSAAVPRGAYDALRLTLGTGHTVRYVNGADQSLTGPANLMAPGAFDFTATGASSSWQCLVNASSGLANTGAGVVFNPRDFRVILIPR